MKLHLPLILRSALLAVLASFSIVHAEDADYVEKEFADKDGKLEEKTYTENLYITVQKDGLLTIDSDDTKLAGESTIIDVYGGIKMSKGRIAYADGPGSNATASITVNKGGSFLTNGSYADIAYARNEGTAHVDIEVNGSFENNRGRIAYAYGSGSNATANITINKDASFLMDALYSIISMVNDGGTTHADIEVNGSFEMSCGNIAYAYGGSATATIIINEGGSFLMKNDDFSSIAQGNVGSSVHADIEVNGSFEMYRGAIAYSSYSYSGGKATANITINKGGSFLMNGQYAYIAHALKGGRAHADIEVNGSFEMSGGYISHVANLGDVNATANIIINEGGSFLMNSGNTYIAYASTEDSTSARTHTAHADIEVYGSFEMRDGNFAITDGNPDSKASANILIAKEGQFIYSAGTFGSDVMFTLKDQGSLNMGENSFTADVTMRGGKLVGARNYSGNLIIDVESGFGGSSVDLGGVDAARITSVKVAQPGVQITGLMADSTLTLSGSDNQLAVGVGNTNLTGGSNQAIIVFNDGSGIVSFDSDTLSLMLDIKANVLSALRAEDSTFTITLTNGDITNWEDVNFTFRSVLTELAGFNVQSVVGGTLVIQGSADNLFIASRDGEPGDNGRETTPEDVQGKDAVIVDEDLTVNAGEKDVTMNHVDSLGEDTDLTVKGNSGDDINAEFHNEKGVDTELGGDLTITNEGAGKAHMEKTGEGRFTVGGNLNVDGNLDVQEGGLTLNGEDNHVGGDVSVGDKQTGTEGNLEVNGSLTVEGDMDLSKGKGSVTGDGDIHIGEDGSLTLGDEVDFDGPSLDLEGDLNMNDQDVTLGGLNGDGTVNGPGDITIDGEGGDFSGDLTGSGSITVTGEGTDQSFTGASGPDWDLEVKDGGHLSLTESTFHDVEAKKDGNLEFRAKGTGAKDSAGANVHLTGNLIFRNGSTTTLTLNMNADELWEKNQAMMVSTDGSIYIERQAAFKLNALQEEMPKGRGGDLTNIVVMTGNEIHVADEFPDVIGLDLQNQRAAGESLNVSLTGLFSLYYEDPTLMVLGNEVLMSARYNEKAPGNNDNNTTGALEEKARDLGGSSTAQAGAGLLDHSDLAGDSTLSEVGNALGNMLASGNNAGALKLMAAVAGSTVTSLGAAQRDATRGEMQRLRRLAGVRLPQVSGESLPMHMWIEGNGDFRRLSSEGDLSGYRLNSWGGTVGAAVAPGKDVLLGLSLSAQYGDLEASAADSAKGDLDGYYLSLFAHVRERAWGHSFSATLGKHEASLNRVVDFGEGSYATQGSTSGSAYGLAYELTYDMPLAEGGRSILQPLVSVSLVSTSMDGYAEQGAGGAGLSVGRQKWTTSSVAVGARWLAQLSDSVFGRGAHTELHVALAQDMGDTQGSASVALQANPGYSRQVQGAEIGRTSLQLGAGLALPVSESKQLYIYTHADLRSGSTSWNLGSGLRMAF